MTEDTPGPPLRPWRPRRTLTPFSAPLNSPEVHDDGTVTFRLEAPGAKDVKLAGWALLTALGRLLPNLWRQP